VICHPVRSHTVSHAIVTAHRVLRSLKLPTAVPQVVVTTFARGFESYLRSHSFNSLTLAALCLSFDWNAS